MAHEQRRRHPRPRHRRRGRHPGLYKLISAVLIVAAVVAACLIFFRVSKIEVKGNTRYTDQEIMDVAGIRNGDNLFSVRGDKVSAQLQSRLPYIRGVTVRRKLPNTIELDVTEGKALAAVELDGHWWLLDVDGKLLEQTSSASGYARITGIEPLAPVAGGYLALGEERKGKTGQLTELLSGMESSGLISRLDSVDLSEDYRLTFVLDGRFTVHISPSMERGMGLWLRQLSEKIDAQEVSRNQNYTVEIMNDREIHFIPQ